MGIKIPLIVGIVLLVSVVLLFGLEEPIEVKEGVSQKTVRILTPTETILVPEIHTSEIKEIKSSSIVEKISEPSLSAQGYPFGAYALGPEVDQIDFLKYTDIDLGTSNNQQYAFDSNFNLFHGDAGEILYFDRTAETKTIWNIPNSGSIFENGMTTDSSGNVYFGQKSNILTKLDPSTDTFTQVQFGLPTSFNYDALEVSSSGDVYFSTSNSVGKVNFDTGLVTTWPEVGFFPQDMELDSNENFYYITSTGIPSFIVRINPTTNLQTTWQIDDDSFLERAMAIDNNDIIYVYEFEPTVRGKIVRLDPTTNVLEEWFIPTTSPGFAKEHMAIDSAGTVYYLEEFSRFVPSSGNFTKWNTGNLVLVDVDSNDDVWIAGDGFFGKITATP